MFYCVPREHTPRRRGFTLIEMLVVMAIIGILVALLLPVLGIVRRNAKEAATRGLIKSLETAIAAYEFDWGQFPPDGYAPLPGPPPVPVNGYTPANAAFAIQSSSALFYYLSTPFRQTPTALKGEVWASKDCGPYLDVPVSNQRFPGAASGQCTDIIDVFGRPIAYDNVRDPQASATGFDPYPLKEIRNDPTLVAPSVQHPGNQAQNLQGVDIFSLGVGGNLQCTRPLANFKCLWEP